MQVGSLIVWLRIASVRRTARVFALTVAVVLGGAALAQGSKPGLVVRVHPADGVPYPYFRVHASPGQRTTAGTVQLVNGSDRPVTVRLAPVDGVTATTLGSAYGPMQEARRGPASWLKLGVRHTRVPAHSTRAIRVAVRPPPGALSGDVLAGVAVEQLGQDRATQKGSLSVAQIERYAVGVETFLPGTRYRRIVFTGASAHRDPSGLVVDFKASNRGNVILTGVRGRLEVTRSDGGARRLAVVTAGPGTFVSGTSIAYPVRIHGQQPAAGTRYLAHGYLRYHGGIARIDQTVTVGESVTRAERRYGTPPPARRSGFPWWIIVVAGGLAALIGLLGWLWLRHRRSAIRGRDAAISHLEREIAACRADRPLSVVVLEARNAAEDLNGPAHELRRVVRRGDGMYRIAGKSLLVVCPDTSAVLAAGIAAEARERLRRAHDPTATAGAMTTADPSTSAERLVASARSVDRFTDGDAVGTVADG